MRYISLKSAQIVFLHKIFFGKNDLLEKIALGNLHLKTVIYAINSMDGGGGEKRKEYI